MRAPLARTSLHAGHSFHPLPGLVGLSSSICGGECASLPGAWSRHRRKGLRGGMPVALLRATGRGAGAAAEVATLLAFIMYSRRAGMSLRLRPMPQAFTQPR